MPDTYNVLIAYEPSTLTIYGSNAAVDYTPTVNSLLDLPRMYSIITDKVEADSRGEAIALLKKQIPIPEKIEVKSSYPVGTPIVVSFDGTTVNLEALDQLKIRLDHDQIDPLIHALNLYRNRF